MLRVVLPLQQHAWAAAGALLRLSNAPASSMHTSAPRPALRKLLVANRHVRSTVALLLLHLSAFACQTLLHPRSTASSRPEHPCSSEPRTKHLQSTAPWPSSHLSLPDSPLPQPPSTTASLPTCLHVLPAPPFRGEIACRVLVTARRLGIPSVAVFSEADRAAKFVGLADEAFCIGPAAARESYLRGDVILDVAKKAGVDAIHPGE